jgi:hypothetical protein
LQYRLDQASSLSNITYRFATQLCLSLTTTQTLSHLLSRRLTFVVNESYNEVSNVTIRFHTRQTKFPYQSSHTKNWWEPPCTRLNYEEQSQGNVSNRSSKLMSRLCSSHTKRHGASPLNQVSVYPIDCWKEASCAAYHQQQLICCGFQPKWQLLWALFLSLLSEVHFWSSSFDILKYVRLNFLECL